MNHIIAVLVSYNPNISELTATVNSVLNQVSELIIVDNGSTDFSNDWLTLFNSPTNTKLHLLAQTKNLGIAAAHNIGIDYAIKHGAEFVLLLDQDSQMAKDTVLKLYTAYQTLTASGMQVAAIGSQYVDQEHGALSPFVTIKNRRFVNCQCETNLAQPDFIISSGSLLPVTALNSIGLMDASLFIDLVDIEWCYRARFKGWQIYGVCDAIMTHALGEHRQEISWLGYKRIISVHKPFRYYYIFRNNVLLFRRAYIPRYWKIAEFIRCVKTVLLFTLVSKQRWAILKMMGLGVFDGLRNKTGQLNP